jgi:hypothetical protein
LLYACKGLDLKEICDKIKDQTIFLENSTGKPEIVLVFPITRDVVKSSDTWMTVLAFVASSEISTLLIIDKTEQGSATDFFMDHFEIENKRLLVLPRSLKDTLFDTLGEIVLDENMWIIQLHDDDYWSGEITLPDCVGASTVYFSDYYLCFTTKGLNQIYDFSIPNRIVFSLVPAMIWNRFAQIVQDQNYHVAGSFDFTLNMMAQLVCKFEYRQGFKYYWKDDNWNTSKNAIAHLTRLAENDGWEGWSSPEIANFNRSIDNLASLKYLKDLLNPAEIEREIRQIIKGLSPSYRKRLKLGLYILVIYPIVKIQKLIFKVEGEINPNSRRLYKELSLHQLIVKTWHIQSIENIIDLIIYIESQGSFKKLHFRFQYWKQALSELNEGH